MVDQGADILFLEDLVPHVLGHEIGQDRFENQAARRGIDHAAVHHRPDPGVDIQVPAVQSRENLFDIGEELVGPLDLFALQRQIVKTQDHILARYRDGPAAGGQQDVHGAEHQQFALGDRLLAQGHMDRHLVAVEVGVEGGADQRVQLDRFAVDQDRVKGLNRKFVQGRGAVEHHRILVDDLLQTLPHFVGLLLDQVLGRFEGGGVPLLLQFGQQVGFEELQGHVFGQTALIHPQVGTHDDDRTAGEVDPLTQQVLADSK